MSDENDSEQDLRDSLDALSRVLTGSQTLETTLVQVARLAVDAVPGASGASVTIHRDGRAEGAVPTNALVRQVDAIQYAVKEGPCLSAVRDRRVQRSGSLGGDPRWPRFGPRAGRSGLHSTLSIPLLLDDHLVGALNVYSTERDAFDDEAERVGSLFAGPAGVSIRNAQVLAESQRLASQLAEALTSRAVIDRAVGIVMSQSGAEPDEAFDRLRQISQREKVKLAEVARRLVDEAVRRARSRASARQESSVDR